VRGLTVFLAAFVLLVFAARATAQEPTPTPGTTPSPGTPPTPVGSCPQASFEGPATRTINQAQIMAPAGSYALGIPPPGSPDGAFSLCHLQTGAIITISSKTCIELGRSALSAEGTAVLNQIIASCKVLPPATPAPASFTCPEGDAVRGGQAMTVADSIQVELPDGDFVVTVRNADIAVFCNPSAQYDVAIRLGDCGQASIPSPFVDPTIIRGIVASCTLLHPVTPLPAAPSTIQPPNTGEAGLR